jgi:hypothetical protein
MRAIMMAANNSVNPMVENSSGHSMLAAIVGAPVRVPSVLAPRCRSGQTGVACAEMVGVRGCGALAAALPLFRSGQSAPHKATVGGCLDTPKFGDMGSAGRPAATDG